MREREREREREQKQCALRGSGSDSATATRGTWSAVARNRAALYAAPPPSSALGASAQGQPLSAPPDQPPPSSALGASAQGQPLSAPPDQGCPGRTQETRRTCSFFSLVFILVFHFLSFFFFFEIAQEQLSLSARVKEREGT